MPPGVQLVVVSKNLWLRLSAFVKPGNEDRFLARTRTHNCYLCYPKRWHKAFNLSSLRSRRDQLALEKSVVRSFRVTRRFWKCWV
jgi:hypothetical protein